METNAESRMTDHANKIRPRLELLADLLTKKIPDGTLLNVALSDIAAALKGVDALLAEHEWVGELNKALNEQNARLVAECDKLLKRAEAAEIALRELDVWCEVCMAPHKGDETCHRPN